MSAGSEGEINTMARWLGGGAATQSTAIATEDGPAPVESSRMEEDSAGELPAALAGASVGVGEDRSNDGIAPMDLSLIHI